MVLSAVGCSRHLIPNARKMVEIGLRVGDKDSSEIDPSVGWN